MDYYAEWADDASGAETPRVPTLDEYSRALAEIAERDLQWPVVHPSRVDTEESPTMKAIELKRGDKCPNCGGELKPARVPTAEEYRRAFDKENPIALPPSVDTASPEQRADLGELWICEHNDYRVRFAAEKKSDQPRGDQAGA